ncbi:MAG TPA: DNA or RNA helicase of superfamily II [Pseudomonas sabulinigri]|uniref:DNA or RNA helicase of superfamily II n=1 Tax=marine sediment metagenome TaxID=412755 RepID=A0A0F9RPL1_9ZZZZ|nr:DNA or RNA helicase of superfamily II [Halopseudomonas sabulinigri]HEC50955.1 DNA or RNA helicase of superfamily II [Halopseudomonas sabulinigri]
MQSTRTDLCPLCGNANQCDLAATADSSAPCWCFSTPISKEALARVPTDQVDKTCLCPRCAAGIEASEAAAQS